MITSYRGQRTPQGCQVERVRDGSEATPLEPGPSLAVREHSPTGFEWGYLGSGPAQLALAILLDLGVPPTTAADHYQALKAERIAILTADSWELNAIPILDWLALRLVPAEP